MLSRRPYLIRALVDWLVDSGEVPHLLVDTTRHAVEVPESFIQDGRIVLNIGPDAVDGLQLGNDDISFSARFHGKPGIVRFPPDAVIAVYGRDSGQGMMFGPEEETDESDGESQSSKGKDSNKPGKPTKPSLKIIK